MAPTAIALNHTPSASPSVEDEDEIEPLDVLDLPHPSTRPSAPLLLQILAAVTIHPRSWGGDGSTVKKQPPHLARRRYAGLASAPGLAKWLTSLVANELRWIEEDEVKERIWEECGRRLSERCGRVAMPAVTRGFRIPLLRRPRGQGGVGSEGSSGVNSSAVSVYGGREEEGDGEREGEGGLGERKEVEGVDYVTVTLHEPSMTADNLGFKTWGSSYLLARRLGSLGLPPPAGVQGQLRALELGSGTGLVGIACAAVLGAAVTLTDLPEIVPNLRHNVLLNTPLSNPLLPPGMGSMDVQVLDWTDPPLPASEEDKYPLVLAADPIYSREHPGLVMGVLEKWVRRSADARVVVETPLRERYEDVREEFWGGMERRGFVLVEGGVETGWDDWGGGERGGEDGDGDGEAGKVRCWWGVYRWAGHMLVQS